MSHTGPPTTTVNIMFTSPKVIVNNEKEAYPANSLIAECGGLLGLFVGFNFLMFWDFIVYFYRSGKSLKVIFT